MFINVKRKSCGYIKQLFSTWFRSDSDSNHLLFRWSRFWKPGSKSGPELLPHISSCHLKHAFTSSLKRFFFLNANTSSLRMIGSGDTAIHWQVLLKGQRILTCTAASALIDIHKAPFLIFLILIEVDLCKNRNWLRNPWNSTKYCEFYWLIFRNLKY
jgi:hypothetical protein